MSMKGSVEVDVEYIEPTDCQTLTEDLILAIEKCSDGYNNAITELLTSLEENSSNFCIFLARLSGRIVGYTYIYEKNGAVQGGWFMVHPKYRRKGIGASLHDSVIAHLSEIGVNSITQTAATDAGREFLISCGFESTSEGDTYSFSV